jgi:membrane protein DedA with SNARE-associated domain
VSTLIAQYGLIIVALIIFAGEIGLPTLLPGEIALLIAGNQVIHSVPMLLGVIVLFAAVDLVATSSIHTASRTGGNRLLSCLLRMTCRKGTRPEALLEDCRRRLGGHDSVVVFVTRLIPVFRLYASIGTGLIRIRFRDFLAGAAPAALVWAAMPLTVGYVLRSQVGGMVCSVPRNDAVHRDCVSGRYRDPMLHWVAAPCWRPGRRTTARAFHSWSLGRRWRHGSDLEPCISRARARRTSPFYSVYSRVLCRGNSYRPDGLWASLGRWT